MNDLFVTMKDKLYLSVKNPFTKKIQAKTNN